MADTLSGIVAAWGHLPIAFAVDAARQDQDARWKRGERPPVEVYLLGLPRVAASAEDALVLIYGEVMNRAALGERFAPEDYYRRFPHLRKALSAIFAVHAGLGETTLGSGSEPAAPLVPPEIPGVRDLRFHARGGTAAVYRGTAIATGETVAVKILALTDASTHAILRQLQEAEILAKLNHPNIVHFIGAGAVGDRFHLIAEWISGGTLADRIGTPHPREWCLAILTQLADAVQCAHDRGIIHRDLKPSNVLMTDTGEPKVSDFGTARLLHCEGLISNSGEPIGTAAYMPPEQLEGRHADVGPPADVYALGAILVELLTGKPFVDGRTLMELVHRSLTQTSEALDEVRLRHDHALAELCTRCVARNPHDRFPTASSLGEALRTLMAANTVC